jgi:gliding motility-associated-like protein
MSYPNLWDMIYRFLLWTLFTVSMLCSNLNYTFSQVREVAIDQEYKQRIKSEIEIISRGAATPEVLSSLNPYYCSDDAFSDIYVDPLVTPFPVGTTYVEWYIYVADGGGDIPIQYVVDPIGTNPNNGVRFFPDRVLPEHRNMAIVFSYRFRVGIAWTGGASDWTYVVKRPNSYSFAQVISICQGQNTSLTLSGSENGTAYFLYKDGLQYRPFPAIGTPSGNPIVFPNINESGNYTIVAVNSYSPPELPTSNFRCELQMAGVGAVTVNPLPVPTASSNSPLCEGQTVELFGGPDAMSSYSWTGPNGYTSLDRNPVINNSLRASHHGTYTLTVGDINGCFNSINTNVVVNTRPTAIISGTATICDGDLTPISIALTGQAPWSVTYTDGVNPVTVNGIAASPYGFSVSPSSSATYTVTAVSDASTCSGNSGDISGAAVITVNARPTSVLSGGGTICNGDNIDLTVNLTGTGQWNITYSDGNGGSFNTTANSSPFSLNVAPTSNSNYTITALSDVNCSASGADMTGNAVVNVNARPTSVISVFGNDVLCDGGSTTIRIALTGAAPWNLTYTINGVPTVVNNIMSSPYDFVVSPSETTTYLVSALSDALCTAVAGDMTGSAVVTVNDRPTAHISGTATICNGNNAVVSIALTGTGPWDISYTQNGVPQTVNTMLNPYEIDISPSADVEFILTALEDANCVALNTDLTGSAIITVNDRPTAVLSGGGTICNGGSEELTINFTGTGPWNVTLSANGVPFSVNTNTNPYSFSVSPSASTTYVITGLGDVNCSAIASDLSGTADVIVNPRPTANISGSSTICDGSNTNLTIVLTGTAPWNIIYSYNGNPVPINNILTSPHVLNVSPDVTTTYLITAVSDANGCNAIASDLSGSAVVTVNDRPTAVLSGGGTICNGDDIDLSVTLTGVAPWSIAYTDGIGGNYNVVANVSPFTLNVSPTASSNYTITGLSDDNCTAIGADLSGNALVNVNARPTSVVSLVGNATLCEGEQTTIRFTLSGVGPWSLTYSANGTEVTIPVATSPHDLIVTPTTTTTYVVTALSDANCSAIASDMTGSVNVIVNARPTAVISGSATICNGDNTNISIALTGQAPWDITYTVAGTPLNVTGILTSPHIIPVSPSSTTEYLVTVVTDANSCGALGGDLSGSALVAVNARPTASISGGGTICAGDDIGLTINLTGVSPWNLTYNDGIGGSYNIVINTTPHNFDVSPIADSNYTITALSDANCSATGADLSGNASVTVNARPTAVVSGTVTVCEGTSVDIDFALTGQSPWNLTYSVNGTPFVVNNILTSPYSISVSPTETTTYLVTSLSDANCTAEASDLSGSAVVTVNDRPTAVLSGGGTICNGDDIDLSVTLTGVAPWSIAYTDGIGGNYNVVANVSPFTLNVSPTASSNYTITGLSDDNCTAIGADLSGNALVNVNARPTSVVSLVGNATLCEGEQTTIRFTLSGVGPWSLTYSANGTEVTIPVATSPHDLIVTPTTTTTYVVTALSDANCSAIASDMTGSVNVTVNARPTAVISGSATICNGDNTNISIALTGQAPWDITYTVAGTPLNVTGILTSPHIIPVSPSSTTEYLVTVVTDANSCGALGGDLSGSALVAVNARPTASISGGGTICAGDDIGLSIALTGTGPWNLTYSDGIGGSDNIVVNSSPHNFDVSPIADSNYTITALSDANCSATGADLSGNASVTVNARPTAVVSGTATVCEGTSVDIDFALTGQSPWNLTYSVNGTPFVVNNILTSPYSISVSPTETTTYLVTSLSDANCTAEAGDISGSAVVTVNAIPSVTLSISSSLQTDYCYTEPIEFTVLENSYSSYVFNIGGVEYGNGSSNVLNLDDIPVGTHNVFVVVSDGTCTATSSTETITIRPLPTTTLVLDDPLRTTVCTAETVDFTASGADEYLFLLDGVVQGVRSATNTFSHSSTTNFTVAVIGYNAFECELLSNEIAVTVSQPSAGLIVSDTDVCANETVTFTASGGVSYEFFRNNTSLGVSANNILTISNQVDGDEIYVRVIDAFGCEDISQTITLTVFPLPVINFEITTPNGNVICDGEEVIFSASGGTHYAFWVLRDGNDLLLQQGALNTYTTTELEHGDLVYVYVRDANMCNAISSNIAMTVHPNPVVTLQVLPSSHIGAGDPIDVVAGGGVEYLFLLNGTPVDGVWTTDDTWTYSTPQDGDVVSVIARNEFGCETEHPGITLEVDALPIVYQLRPEESFYCADETGVQLYLSGYENFVRYDLFEVSGVPQLFGEGTLLGGMMVWNGVPAGRYIAVATRLTGIGTSIEYQDTALVVVNPVPQAFNMLPNGIFDTCPVVISLDGSETGIDYILYLDGSPLSTPIAGDGNSIAFGAWDIAGVYTILAVNPITGCDTWMNGSTHIDVVPNSAVFDLTSDPADGRYCDGSGGVTLLLSGSVTNAAYVVYLNGVATIHSAIGDGSPISFGPFTQTGVYRVMIAAGGGCIYPMNGSVTVSLDSAPMQFDLEADYDGHFCAGADGVRIWLKGQQADVTYQLVYNGSVLDTKTAGSITDSELPLLFDGLHNQSGEYSVIGIVPGSLCEGEVATISLIEDALPNIYTITGDDGFCADGSFASILLPSSQPGVTYELWFDNGLGNIPTGDMFVGNGGQHVFVVITEGDYSVMATRTDIATACSVLMDGIINIVEKPMPETDKFVDVDITGADCENGAVITIEDSQVDVIYEIWWKVGAVEGQTGITVVGTGSDVTFAEGIVDSNGTYRIRANLNGCFAFLDDDFTVDVPGAIKKFFVLGDGAICEGDGGVQIRLSSSQAGVEYVLWSLGAGVGGINIPVNSVLAAIDDQVLDFGFIMDEGDYIVVGSNIDCDSIPMHGMVELRFNPLPIAYQLTGSGVFCDISSGAQIGLDGSDAGVIYTLLYNDNGIKRTRDIISGSGDPLVFVGQIEPGEYTVYARNPITGCTSSMNGLITVLQLPEPDVSGIEVVYDSEYCSFIGSASVGLSNSQAGITYSVIDEADQVVTSLTRSTSGAFTLGQLTAGTYRIEASRIGDCAVQIDVPFTIVSINSPQVFDLIVPTESVCGSEALIILDGSETGVSYILYEDGAPMLGFEDVRTGNGEQIVWDLSGVSSGSYLLHVRAETSDGACYSETTLELVTIRQGVNDFNVNLPDGTNYCESDGGVSVGITITQTGVGYQLILDGETVAYFDGNGASRMFTGVHGAGSYQVFARNYESGCTLEKTISITETAGPAVYTLSRSADECAAQLIFTLSSSEVGVNYTLMVNGAPWNSVSSLEGTGGVIQWAVTGTLGIPYDFYVEAAFDGVVDGCVSRTNVVSATFRSTVGTFSYVLPQGDFYCYDPDGVFGTDGVEIGIDISYVGVGYQLMKDGLTLGFLDGNGSGMVFSGLHNAGNYMIRARHYESGCVYQTSSFEIEVDNTPSVFDVSAGGSVNFEEIVLDGSEPNVQYYLERNHLPVDMTPIEGNLDNSAINFGTVSLSGDYRVFAIGQGGCISYMNGIAKMYETPLVAVNDTLFLRPGDLVGVILSLGDNDELLSGVDLIGDGGNIRFSATGEPPIGEVVIDPITGMLTYSKLPSFYGIDSLSYVIRNVDLPERSSIATVYIFVGNKPIGQEESFLLPNAFSPNGDGFNDKFVISGLGATEETTLEVFNRWGTVVYRSEGRYYNNDWDGRANIGAMVSIGKELPNGVYFYVFEVTKNVEGEIVRRKYSGYIELRR